MNKIKELASGAATWIGVGLAFGFGFALSVQFFGPLFLRFVLMPLVF